MNALGRWYEARRKDNGGTVYVRRFVAAKTDADAAGSPTCEMVEVWADGGYPHVITQAAARHNFVIVAGLGARMQRQIEARRSYEMGH